MQVLNQNVRHLFRILISLTIFSLFVIRLNDFIMKKFLFIFTLISAITFGSCTYSTESTTETTDSVKVENVDTIAVDSMVVDTLTADTLDV